MGNYLSAQNRDTEPGSRQLLVGITHSQLLFSLGELPGSRNEIVFHSRTAMGKVVKGSAVVHDGQNHVVSVSVLGQFPDIRIGKLNAVIAVLNKAVLKVHPHREFCLNLAGEQASVGNRIAPRIALSGSAYATEC